MLKIKEIAPHKCYIIRDETDLEREVRTNAQISEASSKLAEPILHDLSLISDFSSKFSGEWATSGSSTTFFESAILDEDKTEQPSDIDDDFVINDIAPNDNTEQEKLDEEDLESTMEAEVENVVQNEPGKIFEDGVGDKPRDEGIKSENESKDESEQLDDESKLDDDIRDTSIHEDSEKLQNGPTEKTDSTDDGEKTESVDESEEGAKPHDDELKLGDEMKKSESTDEAETETEDESEAKTESQNYVMKRDNELNQEINSQGDVTKTDADELNDESEPNDDVISSIPELKAETPCDNDVTKTEDESMQESESRFDVIKLNSELKDQPEFRDAGLDSNNENPTEDADLTTADQPTEVLENSVSNLDDEPRYEIVEDVDIAPDNGLLFEVFEETAVENETEDFASYESQETSESLADDNLQQRVVPKTEAAVDQILDQFGSPQDASPVKKRDSQQLFSYKPNESQEENESLANDSLDTYTTASSATQYGEVEESLITEVDRNAQPAENVVHAAPFSLPDSHDTSAEVHSAIDDSENEHETSLKDRNFATDEAEISIDEPVISENSDHKSENAENSLHEPEISIENAGSSLHESENVEILLHQPEISLENAEKSFHEPANTENSFHEYENAEMSLHELENAENSINESENPENLLDESKISQENAESLLHEPEKDENSLQEPETAKIFSTDTGVPENEIAFDTCENLNSEMINKFCSDLVEDTIDHAIKDYDDRNKTILSNSSVAAPNNSSYNSLTSNRGADETLSKLETAPWDDENTQLTNVTNDEIRPEANDILNAQSGLVQFQNDDQLSPMETTQDSSRIVESSQDSSFVTASSGSRDRLDDATGEIGDVTDDVTGDVHSTIPVEIEDEEEIVEAIQQNDVELQPDLALNLNESIGHLSNSKESLHSQKINEPFADHVYSFLNKDLDQKPPKYPGHVKRPSTVASENFAETPRSGISMMSSASSNYEVPPRTTDELQNDFSNILSSVNTNAVMITDSESRQSEENEVTMTNLNESERRESKEESLHGSQEMLSFKEFLKESELNYPSPTNHQNPDFPDSQIDAEMTSATLPRSHNMYSRNKAVSMIEVSQPPKRSETFDQKRPVSLYNIAGDDNNSLGSSGRFDSVPEKIFEHDEMPKPKKKKKWYSFLKPKRKKKSNLVIVPDSQSPSNSLSRSGTPLSSQNQIDAFETPQDLNLDSDIGLQENEDPILTATEAIVERSPSEIPEILPDDTENFVDQGPEILSNPDRKIDVIRVLDIDRGRSFVEAFGEKVPTNQSFAEVSELVEALSLDSSVEINEDEALIGSEVAKSELFVPTITITPDDTQDLIQQQEESDQDANENDDVEKKEFQEAEVATDSSSDSDDDQDHSKGSDANDVTADNDANDATADSDANNVTEDNDANPAFENNYHATPSVPEDAFEVDRNVATADQIDSFDETEQSSENELLHEEEEIEVAELDDILQNMPEEIIENEQQVPTSVLIDALSAEFEPEKIDNLEDAPDNSSEDLEDKHIPTPVLIDAFSAEFAQDEVELDNEVDMPTDESSESDDGSHHDNTDEKVIPDHPRTSDLEQESDDKIQSEIENTSTDFESQPEIDSKIVKQAQIVSASEISIETASDTDLNSESEKSSEAELNKTIEKDEIDHPNMGEAITSFDKVENNNQNVDDVNPKAVISRSPSNTSAGVSEIHTMSQAPMDSISEMLNQSENSTSENFSQSGDQLVKSDVQNQMEHEQTDVEENSWNESNDVLEQSRTNDESSQKSFVEAKPVDESEQNSEFEDISRASDASWDNIELRIKTNYDKLQKFINDPEQSKDTSGNESLENENEVESENEYADMSGKMTPTNLSTDALEDKDGSENENSQIHFEGTKPDSPVIRENSPIEIDSSREKNISLVAADLETESMSESSGDEDKENDFRKPDSRDDSNNEDEISITKDSFDKIADDVATNDEEQLESEIPSSKDQSLDLQENLQSSFKSDGCEKVDTNNDDLSSDNGTQKINDRERNDVADSLAKTIELQKAGYDSYFGDSSDNDSEKSLHQKDSMSSESESEQAEHHKIESLMNPKDDTESREISKMSEQDFAEMKPESPVLMQEVQTNTFSANDETRFAVEKLELRQEENLDNKILLDVNENENSACERSRDEDDRSFDLNVDAEGEVENDSFKSNSDDSLVREAEPTNDLMKNGVLDGLAQTIQLKRASYDSYFGESSDEDSEISRDINEHDDAGMPVNINALRTQIDEPQNESNDKSQSEFEGEINLQQAFQLQTSPIEINNSQNEQSIKNDQKDDSQLNDSKTTLATTSSSGSEQDTGEFPEIDMGNEELNQVAGAFEGIPKRGESVSNVYVDMAQNTKPDAKLDLRAPKTVPEIQVVPADQNESLRENEVDLSRDGNEQNQKMEDPQNSKEFLNPRKPTEAELELTQEILEIQNRSKMSNSANVSGTNFPPVLEPASRDDEIDSSYDMSSDSSNPSEDKIRNLRRPEALQLENNLDDTLTNDSDMDVEIAGQLQMPPGFSQPLESPGNLDSPNRSGFFGPSVVKSTPRPSESEYPREKLDMSGGISNQSDSENDNSDSVIERSFDGHDKKPDIQITVAAPRKTLEVLRDLTTKEADATDGPISKPETNDPDELGQSSSPAPIAAASELEIYKPEETFPVHPIATLPRTSPSATLPSADIFGATGAAEILVGPEKVFKRKASPSPMRGKTKKKGRSGSKKGKIESDLTLTLDDTLKNEGNQDDAKTLEAAPVDPLDAIEIPHFSSELDPNFSEQISIIPAPPLETPPLDTDSQLTQEFDPPEDFEMKLPELPPETMKREKRFDPLVAELKKYHSEHGMNLDSSRESVNNPNEINVSVNGSNAELSKGVTDFDPDTEFPTDQTAEKETPTEANFETKALPENEKVPVEMNRKLRRPEEKPLYKSSFNSAIVPACFAESENETPENVARVASVSHDPDEVEFGSNLKKYNNTEFLNNSGAFNDGLQDEEKSEFSLQFSDLSKSDDQNDEEKKCVQAEVASSEDSDSEAEHSTVFNTSNENKKFETIIRANVETIVPNLNEQEDLGVEPENIKNDEPHESESEIDSGKYDSMEFSNERELNSYITTDFDTNELSTAFGDSRENILETSDAALKNPDIDEVMKFGSNNFSRSDVTVDESDFEIESKNNHVLNTENESKNFDQLVLENGGQPNFVKINFVPAGVSSAESSDIDNKIESTNPVEPLDEPKNVTNFVDEDEIQCFSRHPKVIPDESVDTVEKSVSESNSDIDSDHDDSKDFSNERELNSYITTDFDTNELSTAFGDSRENILETSEAALKNSDIDEVMKFGSNNVSRSDVTVDESDFELESKTNQVLNSANDGKAFDQIVLDNAGQNDFQKINFVPAGISSAETSDDDDDKTNSENQLEALRDELKNSKPFVDEGSIEFVSRLPQPNNESVEVDNIKETSDESVSSESTQNESKQEESSSDDLDDYVVIERSQSESDFEVEAKKDIVMSSAGDDLTNILDEPIEFRKISFEPFEVSDISDGQESLNESNLQTFSKANLENENLDTDLVDEDSVQPFSRKLDDGNDGTVGGQNEDEIADVDLNTSSEKSNKQNEDVDQKMSMASNENDDQSSELNSSVDEKSSDDQEFETTPKPGTLTGRKEPETNLHIVKAPDTPKEFRRSLFEPFEVSDYSTENENEAADESNLQRSPNNNLLDPLAKNSSENINDDRNSTDISDYEAKNVLPSPDLVNFEDPKAITVDGAVVQNDSDESERSLDEIQKSLEVDENIPDEINMGKDHLKLESNPIIFTSYVDQENESRDESQEGEPEFRRSLFQPFVVSDYSTDNEKEAADESKSQLSANNELLESNFEPQLNTSEEFDNQKESSANVTHDLTDDAKLNETVSSEDPEYKMTNAVLAVPIDMEAHNKSLESEGSQNNENQMNDSDSKVDLKQDSATKQENDSSDKESETPHEFRRSLFQPFEVSDNSSGNENETSNESISQNYVHIEIPAEKSDENSFEKLSTQDELAANVPDIVLENDDKFNDLATGDDQEHDTSDSTIEQSSDQEEPNNSAEQIDLASQASDSNSDPSRSSMVADDHITNDADYPIENPTIPDVADVVHPTETDAHDRALDVGKIDTSVEDSDIDVESKQNLFAPSAEQELDSSVKTPDLSNEFRRSLFEPFKVADNSSDNESEATDDSLVHKSANANLQNQKSETGSESDQSSPEVSRRLDDYLSSDADQNPEDEKSDKLESVTNVSAKLHDLFERPLLGVESHDSSTIKSEIHDASALLSDQSNLVPDVEQELKDFSHNSDDESASAQKGQVDTEKHSLTSDYLPDIKNEDFGRAPEPHQLPRFDLDLQDREKSSDTSKDLDSSHEQTGSEQNETESDFEVESKQIIVMSSAGDPFENFEKDPDATNKFAKINFEPFEVSNISDENKDLNESDLQNPMHPNLETGTSQPDLVEEHIVKPISRKLDDDFAADENNVTTSSSASEEQKLVQEPEDPSEQSPEPLDQSEIASQVSRHNHSQTLDGSSHVSETDDRSIEYPGLYNSDVEAAKDFEQQPLHLAESSALSIDEPEAEVLPDSSLVMEIPESDVRIEQNDQPADKPQSALELAENVAELSIEVGDPSQPIPEDAGPSLKPGDAEFQTFKPDDRSETPSERVSVDISDRVHASLPPVVAQPSFNSNQPSLRRSETLVGPEKVFKRKASPSPSLKTGKSGKKKKSGKSPKPKEQESDLTFTLDDSRTEQNSTPNANESQTAEQLVSRIVQPLVFDGENTPTSEHPDLLSSPTFEDSATPRAESDEETNFKFEPEINHEKDATLKMNPDFTQQSQPVIDGSLSEFESKSYDTPQTDDSPVADAPQLDQGFNEVPTDVGIEPNSIPQNFDNTTAGPISDDFGIRASMLPSDEMKKNQATEDILSDNLLSDGQDNEKLDSNSREMVNFGTEKNFGKKTKAPKLPEGLTEVIDERRPSDQIFEVPANADNTETTSDKNETVSESEFEPELKSDQVFNNEIKLESLELNQTPFEKINFDLFDTSKHSESESSKKSLDQKEEDSETESSLKSAVHEKSFEVDSRNLEHKSPSEELETPVKLSFQNILESFKVEQETPSEELSKQFPGIEDSNFINEQKSLDRPPENGGSLKKLSQVSSLDDNGSTSSIEKFAFVVLPDQNEDISDDFDEKLSDDQIPKYEIAAIVQNAPENDESIDDIVAKIQNTAQLENPPSDEENQLPDLDIPESESNVIHDVNLKSASFASDLSESDDNQSLPSDSEYSTASTSDVESRPATQIAAFNDESREATPDIAWHEALRKLHSDSGSLHPDQEQDQPSRPQFENSAEKPEPEHRYGHVANPAISDSLANQIREAQHVISLSSDSAPQQSYPSMSGLGDNYSKKDPELVGSPDEDDNTLVFSGSLSDRNYDAENDVSLLTHSKSTNHKLWLHVNGFFFIAF